MTMDPLWIWIALGTIGALSVIGLFARGARRARTSSLRDQFGPEYDYAVREMGNRTRAERVLLARSDEVKTFEIRPLTVAEYDGFKKDWTRVEQRFVDRPTTAVAEADELVAEIMKVRGYPMGDFDKHAAHLSVTHPRIVEHYRAGHRIIIGSPGSASTEDLRQAMLHYRALFEELTGDPDDVARDVPRANEVSAPRGESTAAPPAEDRRPSDTFR